MAYGYIKDVRSKKYMIHHENKTHFLKRMSLYRLIKKHQNLYTVLGYYIEQFSATWSLASEHNYIYIHDILDIDKMASPIYIYRRHGFLRQKQRVDSHVFPSQKECGLLQMLPGTISGCDVLPEDSPKTSLLHLVCTLSLHADVICSYSGISSPPGIRREGFAECYDPSIASGVPTDGQWPASGVVGSFSIRRWAVKSNPQRSKKIHMYS